jgi:hypothetical protein
VKKSKIAGETACATLPSGFFPVVVQAVPPAIFVAVRFSQSF